VNDENASPLAGSIPQVNDENALPLAENVPPRRVPDNIILMRISTRRARGALQSKLSPLAENVPPKRGVPENTTLVRRSTRRASAALHGEPTSVLEIRVRDSIIGSEPEVICSGDGRPLGMTATVNLILLQLCMYVQYEYLPT
jgi:hypothetical protein